MKFKSIGLFVCGMVIGSVLTIGLMPSEEIEVVENNSGNEVVENVVTDDKNEIKVDKTIIDNEYVEVKILSKVNDENGIGYKIQAKNKTDKNLDVMSMNINFDKQMFTDTYGICISLMPNSEVTETQYLKYNSLDNNGQIESLEDLNNAEIEFEIFEDGIEIDGTNVIVAID